MKVFIDIFIGVWAFILAYVWTNYVNPVAGAERAKVGEIWARFPKFIIGFVVTFAARPGAGARRRGAETYRCGQRSQ